MKKVLTLGAAFATIALIAFNTSCKKDDDDSTECCTISSEGEESTVCQDQYEKEVTDVSWDDYKKNLESAATTARAAGVEYSFQCK